MRKSAPVLAVLAILMACGEASRNQVHLQLGNRPDEMRLWWMTPKRAESVVQFKMGSADWEEAKNWTAPQGEQYSHYTPQRGSYTSDTGPRADPLLLQSPAARRQRQADVVDTFSFQMGSNSHDGTVKFAAIAEQGTPNSPGEGESVQVRNLLMALVNSYDLLVHAGNMASAKGDHATWDRYGEWMQPILASHPVLPAVGSGEAGVERNSEDKSEFVAWENRFNGGSATRLWSSFNYGPVHFVALSSEHDSEEMYTWLKNDLEEADKVTNRLLRPWVIVVLSRPIYNAPDGDPMRPNIVRQVEPLFRNHRVQIVLTGHCQSYERTYPIFRKQVTDWSNGRADQPYITNSFAESQGSNNHGPIYLTVGIGGKNQSTCTGRGWTVGTPWKFHGVALFTATRTRLSFNVLDIEGKSQDNFHMCSIRGCGSAPPLPEGVSIGGSIGPAAAEAVLQRSVGVGLPAVPSKSVTKPTWPGTNDAAGEKRDMPALGLPDASAVPSAALLREPEPLQNTFPGEAAAPVNGTSSGEEALTEVAMADTATADPAKTDEDSSYTTIMDAVSGEWWILLLVLLAIFGCLSLFICACFAIVTARWENQWQARFKRSSAFIVESTPGIKLARRTATQRAASRPRWTSDELDEVQVEMMAAGCNIMNRPPTEPGTPGSYQSGQRQ
eukprot:CAMPEP_0117678666 /NCGR_PEP_ID=MMETSP0804-20121206/17417_1 /TAXON_ID=1074897 /ORGANISM="Tetraselmis astigmatica, Strain CCMP880" /LENGTH=668 /DNA_ID=CAMNT_0005488065 /DNA_START=363 /DNA_END=2370 /DNA_ORIENTATION=+